MTRGGVVSRRLAADLPVSFRYTNCNEQTVDPQSSNDPPHAARFSPHRAVPMAWRLGRKGERVPAPRGSCWAGSRCCMAAPRHRSVPD